MLPSNAMPEEVANRLAAPKMAEFVNGVRLWDKKMKSIYVNEGPVHLGKPTEVTDQELISYTTSRTVKGKTVYSTVSFTAGRVADD